MHAKLEIQIALLAILSSVSADDGYACVAKNPYVLNAIGKFCQNTKLVVPSTYADAGMMSTFNYAFVQIDGTCDPPQWVPQEYCLSQFKRMCANGDKLGNNQASFGKNGCQNWAIQATHN